MTRSDLLFLFAALLFFLLDHPACACSAFSFQNAEGEHFLGKNFDWFTGNGYLLKNRRGIEKCAYGLDGKKNVVEWTSSYGSVTFNQYGRGFPYGGINEAGLVVEALQLPSATYPVKKDAPKVSELEWVQYQLDQHERVPQVIKSLDSLCIRPIKAHLHFMVADRFGNSAVIEFIDGEAEVSRKKGPFQAVTNRPHSLLEDYYQRSELLDSTMKWHNSSEERYCRIMNRASARWGTGLRESGIFEILDTVAQKSRRLTTYWSTVYDITDREIHFKTRGNEKLKRIDLKKLSFEEDGRTKMCPLNSGEVAFKDLTAEADKALLDSSMKVYRVDLNLPTTVQHQMDPGTKRVDPGYAEKHADLRIRLLADKEKGRIDWKLEKWDEEAQELRTVRKGRCLRKASESITLYSLDKGHYFVKAIHDVGSDGIQTNWLGLPSDPFGFSGEASMLHYMLVEDKKRAFSLQKDTTVQVKLE